MTDNVDGDAIDNLGNDFTSALHNVADPLFGKYIKTANHIQPNKCHPAWMNDDCLELRTEYCRLPNISRENTDDENGRRDMVYMRSKYNAKVRQSKSDYDKQFTYQLKNSMASNSKEFWKLLRPQKYFWKLSNPDNVDYIVDDDIYEYMRHPISDAEVQKAIKEHKTGKACGGDMLINELYVCGIVSLLPKLTALFNLKKISAHFPSAWKNGVIIPIYKNGDMSDVNNFRGITLLSTLGKLFTKVLNNRLIFWSDTYDIISDSQAGFRKGWGTIDNIVIIQSIVDYSLEQGEKVYCDFIDFEKRLIT